MDRAPGAPARPWGLTLPLPQLEGAKRKETVHKFYLKTLHSIQNINDHYQQFTTSTRRVDQLANSLNGEGQTVSRGPLSLKGNALRQYQLQRDFIVGTLLGDASIALHRGRTARTGFGYDK